MTRRRSSVLLSLIVLIGLGLRQYALTARSLWFDEAFSWRLIQFPLPEMIIRAASDVHPPLYYILLQAWTTIFGSSLLAMRSMSVLLAGLTIIAAYLFVAAGWRSRSAGLFAALLLALSGFQIQYAWEARMYTLGTALVLFTSWLLLKSVRSNPQRVWWWLAYGISSAAFAYVHYFAFFSIAAQLIWLTAYLLVQTSGRIGELIHTRAVWYSLGGLLLLVLLYLPQIPIFLRQNSQVQDVFWIPKIGGWSIPDTFTRFFAPTRLIPEHNGFWFFVALLAMLGSIIGIIWLVVGHSGRQRSAKDADWLVVLSAIFPFIVSIVISFLGQSVYQDRFFVFAHLFFLIILAVLLHRIPWRLMRRNVYLITCLLFIWAAVNFWDELQILARPGTAAATQYIYAHNDKAPIIVSSPFIFFSVLHYAQENYQDNAPKLYSATDEQLHFTGGPILTNADIVGPSVFAAEVPRIWIVDTTGYSADSLVPPAPWVRQESVTYPEVVEYQGTVTATLYIR